MIDITRFTLDNGLRVVNNYDPTAVMASVTLLYDVGARDESPTLTGMAHLFEHLMFGGSINIPDFDVAIERAGGWNNAWTSNDFTCFYDVAPAANIETLFWLESDRMLSLAFSDKALETQRQVVIEEFKQVCLNKPYGDLAHHLRRMLYSVHPYRWPTIGLEPAHIERVTQTDVRRFFNSHYAPNNAVLAVSGNVTDAEAERLARKWFGPIPRRHVAAREYGPEPPLDAPRRETVRARVPQAMIAMGFPMPGYGQDGYFECDLITDLLASGRSSRFYRRLVMENDLITGADASIIGSEEPGFILVTARLAAADEASVARAEQLILDQLEQLRRDRVSANELERVLNRFESNFTFSALNVVAKSQLLATAEMHREDPNATVSRYRAITADDIFAAARAYLDPARRATLVYLPE